MQQPQGQPQGQQPGQPQAHHGDGDLIAMLAVGLGAVVALVVAAPILLVTLCVLAVIHLGKAPLRWAAGVSALVAAVMALWLPGWRQAGRSYLTALHSVTRPLMASHRLPRGSVLLHSLLGSLGLALCPSACCSESLEPLYWPIAAALLRRQGAPPRPVAVTRGGRSALPGRLPGVG